MLRDLKETKDILSEYTRVRNNLRDMNFGMALQSLKSLHNAFRHLPGDKQTDQIKLEHRMIYLALTATLKDFEILFDVSFQRHLEQLGARNATDDYSVSAARAARLGSVMAKNPSGHSEELPDPREKPAAKAAHN